MSLRLKGTRKYPAIPFITADPAQQIEVLKALKENVETGARRTPDLLNSFIRVQDLLDLGLIDFKGNTTAVVGADLSQIANIGDLTGAAEGDFLRFVGSSWINDQLSTGDITQAMVTQHQAALIIAWSQLTGIPSFVTALDDLLDVDTTTTPPSDGYILTWNAFTSQWEPTPAGAGSVASVSSGLGIDVDNYDPANPVVNLNALLDDLLDVDGVPSDGDVLTWDAGGSTWSPAPPAQALLPEPYTASHNMVLGDQYKGVTMDVASANDFTVQPNSTVACDIGCVTTITQIGAGQTTVVAGVGVTLEYDTTNLTPKTREQYSTVSIWQRATDIWLLSGDLDPV